MGRILDTTVSADGDTDITWTSTRNEAPNRATIYVFGGGGNDFGSGTVAVQVSPDGGTTFMDVKDQAGVSVTFTADGMTNIEIQSNPNPKSSEIVQLRFSLSGSTSPTIRYIVDKVG
jgi:carbon monoxide dehydrogenase subunit G